MREWEATANRVYEIGKKSLSQGHKVSAREAFLRASNYYRMSEFYLRVDTFNNPNMLRLSRLSRETFQKAGELLDTPFENVLIPFEGSTLPSYFFSVDDSGKERPTIVYNNGFDSTREEAYFVIVAAALRRGYNVLAFDGPGSGSVIREDKIFYRNDWEKVITPVLDYCQQRVDVNAEKIVLFGYSLGAYQIARAAAFDKRPAALILNNGMHDFLGSHLKSMPPFLLNWFNSGNDEALIPVLKFLMAKSTTLRWALNNGVWTYNAKNIVDYLRKIKDHTLKDIAAKITTPTLILDAENDNFLKGQPQELGKMMTSSKSTVITMTDAEGAGEHCSEGAMLRLQQVMLDWVDETLA